MAAHDDDWVFVDINGNEVDKADPAVQTRYRRGDFKALDKAVVFGAAAVGRAAKAADAEEREVVDAKSADSSAAAGDDETADTPAAAASVKHGKR